MWCKSRTYSLLALLFSVALVTGCGGDSPADPKNPPTGGGGGSTSCALEQTGAWMWANPKPQGAPILRVRFAAADIVYAISRGGVVLKSCDAGRSWEGLYDVYGVQEVAWGTLYGMHFENENLGWVVGSAGQISKTDDGGTTWINQSVTTDYTMRDIFFHDEMNGFACGDRGLFYRTNDGGSTWTAIAHPAGVSQLNVVTFASTTVGWAAGDDGMVISTTDGGDTWTAVPITQWPEDIRVGQGVGTDEVIFGTRVGAVISGNTTGSWSFRGRSTAVNDLHFTDITNGKILHFKDNMPNIGTMTNGVWTYQELNTAETSAHSFAINGNNISVVGWWGGMMHSADGGDSWQTAFELMDSPPTYTTWFLDVAFSPDGMTGLAVGSYGAMIRSSDAGLTWQERTSGTTEDLLGVWLTSTGTAFAVGKNAVALRSTDNGMTWSPMTTPFTGRRYRSVSMWDADNGLIVGNGVDDESETILMTTDSGDTWVNLDRTPGTVFAMFDVWTQGTDLAWIGSRDGLILHTDDRGLTWTEQTVPDGWQTEKIQFASATHGWGTTQNGIGIISYTTDGGETWELVEGLQSFNDIHFGSEADGIANSQGGSMWSSADGGLTWTQQVSGWSSDGQIKSVWMSSATDGVLVGTESKIQYTRSAGRRFIFTPQ